MGRKPPKPAAEAPKIAAQVEFWALDRLKAYARNARTHPETQVAEIAASIEKFGFAGAILADAKGIVAGHGRKLGLEALFAAGKTVRMIGGLEIPPGHAPVIDCAGWSDADRRAYILADNRIAQNAGWDLNLLALEVGDLKVNGFDISLLGFGESELRAMARKRIADGTDPDDAPPLPKQPISKPGDLWILGEHRLLCGDSTSKADVTRLLNGARPHLGVTDPPYGVNYDASWREKAGASKKGSVAAGKVLNDDRADWREAWALFPGAVIYVWHGALHASTVQQSLEAVGFQVRAQIVWVKTRPVFSRGHYHWQHEPALYAVKEAAGGGTPDHWQDRFAPMHELAEYAVREGGKGHWDGGRQQSTVWTIEHTKSDTGHSTQKPIEAMRRPIINNSAPGDGVYEPFSGSGTTLIACEMEARRRFAMELSPAYVDVAVTRWEQFTGQKAKRDRKAVAA
jgi:DNA modification methylase